MAELRTKSKMDNLGYLDKMFEPMVECISQISRIDIGDIVSDHSP